MACVRRWAAAAASAATPAARGRCRSSLAALVHGRAAQAPAQLALVAPQQNIAWSYGELSSRAAQVAGALAAMGYKRGDVAVTDLPNSVENLVLQVACSHIGTAVATVKDVGALAELAGSASVRGAVTHESDGATDFLREAALAAPTVVLPALDGSLGPLSQGHPSLEMTTPDDAAPLGYWGSTKPLTNGEAISQMGADARDTLRIKASDRVMVSITLCHAFGIGAAVSGALLGGAAVVLPGAGGIRGCGSPSQRAAVTLSVLQAERCSLLFADVHTLKALPSPGAADLSALRGGACKVGSGADFLEDVHEAKLGPNGEFRPLEYAGVPLAAVGRR